jgi:uncharacterized protein YkwD
VEVPRSIFRLVMLTVAVAASAIAASAAAAAGEAHAVVSAPALEPPTIAAINAVRREHGLRPLHVSAQLAASAAVQSKAMGEGGFFSHDSADGTKFSKRIARFYGPRGYSRWTVGENLLWASPTLTPAEAVRSWLASAPHRRILLGSTWSEIGLAAVQVRNAPGAYGGNDVTILTADFGARH